MLGSGGTWIGAVSGGGGGGVVDGKYAYANRFVLINSGTSGTITIPAHSEIVEAGFPSGLNAVLTTSANGTYTSQSAITAAGAIVGADIDTDGDWTLSGTPAAYPVALIYRTRTLWADFEPTDLDIVGDFEVQFPTTGPANRIAAFNSSGNLYSPDGFEVQATGGIRLVQTQNPDGGSGSVEYHDFSNNINPIGNSPNRTTNFIRAAVNIDTENDGFSYGDNGQALNMHSVNVGATGLGDLGALNIFNSYLNVGNGIDAIDVNGFAYFFGFANINDGVTLIGPIQGFIFQPTLAAGVIHDNYSVAFGDFMNAAGAVSGHTSANFSPTLEEIRNNNNYTGVSISPNIETFTGNAGFTGIGLFPQLGELGSNGFQGISINPTIDDAGSSYVAGLSIDMSNVTGSNIRAMQITGDVAIDGDLSFTGNLAIGKLDAFFSTPVINGGGIPGTLHGLITQPTVAANATIALADTIGVNTAMLLTVGDNATVTSALVGISALALPAVVAMGSGSNVDRVAGATFAVSLDAGSTGGTIDTLDMCRAVALPNGVTTITKLHGFAFDLPFGDPGTTTWGFYESPGVHNFFAGDLKIGSGGDTADAGYKLHVEGGGFLLEDSGVIINAFDDKIGFFAATPVVQQASSGAATAGGTYTATEQAMLQEAYNALRAYGLLT
jgi:hypothetical protein